jgi:hypothetical protein
MEGIGGLIKCIGFGGIVLIFLMGMRTANLLSRYYSALKDSDFELWESLNETNGFEPLKHIFGGNDDSEVTESGRLSVRRSIIYIFLALAAVVILEILVAVATGFHGSE